MTKQREKEKQVMANEANSQKNFVSGRTIAEFFQRHRWYILLVFVLALFYISYRFYAEQTILKSQRLEAEVEVRHVEYIIKSEELIKIHKRSEIIKKAQQKGLELIEPKEPPKRIKAN